MQTKQKPSPSNLKAFSKEHLLYEIRMFYGVCDILQQRKYFSGENQEMNMCIRNALLESFVLHLRVILDFLYDVQDKDEDAIAVDYFKDKSYWKSIRPKRSKILKESRLRINKEAAHLSYKRLLISKDQKVWQFLCIKNEVKNILNLFLEKADKDLLDENILNLKN